MAESQARTAELEREMGIAGLGLELAGYDLDKERYEANEKRGLAMSALLAAEYVDADSAEELMNLLNIPESAWDDNHMKELQEFLDENREDDGDDDKEKSKQKVKINEDGQFELTEETTIDVDDYLENGELVESYNVDDSWTLTGETDWGEGGSSNRRYKFYEDEDGNKYYVLYTRVAAE